MQNGNKFDFPARPYYTLKQAVDELNYFFKRSDIDEEYLIQLAAFEKLKIVLNTASVPGISEEESHISVLAIVRLWNEEDISDEILNDVFKKLYYTDQFNSFLLIHYNFFKQYLYDKEWGALSGFSDCFPVTPINNNLESIAEKFTNLTIEFVAVDYNFMIENVYVLRVYGGTGEFSEYDKEVLARRKKIDVSISNLYIIGDELERIKNGKALVSNISKSNIDSYVKPYEPRASSLIQTVALLSHKYNIDLKNHMSIAESLIFKADRLALKNPPSKNSIGTILKAARDFLDESDAIIKSQLESTNSKLE